MIKFILMAISYILGSVPNGVIFGKVLKGKDIRNYGSKNTGATNAYRVFGKGIGITVLIGDILKGAAPVLIGKYFEMPDLYLVLIGAFAILGHTNSIFLKFKGGKGVATSLGVFLVLIPKVVLALIIVFIGIVYFSRYVSLASITVAALMPILELIFYGSQRISIFIFTVIMAAYVIYRHKANIKRLINGEENRFK
ncbi:MAG: glycerol-3-phosphate 1-O-acyltransferase PlsY [Fusobacteriota bacterium]